jgi:hypothetical protein
VMMATFPSSSAMARFSVTRVGFTRAPQVS